MKRIISALFVIAAVFLYINGVFALKKPSNDLYVNDFAGVLNSDVKNYIITQGKILDEKTSAQLVMTTVNSLGGVPLQDYASNLFREWGIGDKAKHNGVLVLLSTEDRKIRIEVGYGLEGAINDGKAGRIINNYGAAYFKNNDWNTGIIQIYKALLYEIYNEYGEKVPDEIINDLKSTNVSKSENDLDIFNICIIIIIIIIFIINFKGGKGTPFIGGPFIGGIGGFGGGNSGGFGRGSSGGFGGGSSGGGGASRGF